MVLVVLVVLGAQREKGGVEARISWPSEILLPAVSFVNRKIRHPRDSSDSLFATPALDHMRLFPCEPVSLVGYLLVACYYNISYLLRVDGPSRRHPMPSF